MGDPYRRLFYEFTSLRVVRKGIGIPGGLDPNRTLPSDRSLHDLYNCDRRTSGWSPYIAVSEGHQDHRGVVYHVKPISSGIPHHRIPIGGQKVSSVIRWIRSGMSIVVIGLRYQHRVASVGKSPCREEYRHDRA